MELSRAFDYAFTIILVGVGVIMLVIVLMQQVISQVLMSGIGVTVLVFAALMIITGYFTFKLSKLESLIRNIPVAVVEEMVGEKGNE
jgi:uncharacterized membrane protein YcaP (DUF421 family)